MSRSTKQPWVKEYNPVKKRIHSRRYRRFIRQDIKKWCNRYKIDLEPNYDPRNKWINPWDICDWRFYCVGPEYLRK